MKIILISALGFYGLIQSFLLFKSRKIFHKPSMFWIIFGCFVLILLAICCFFNLYNMMSLVLALIMIQCGSIFSQFKNGTKVGLFEQLARLLLANLIVLLYYFQSIHL